MKIILIIFLLVMFIILAVFVYLKYYCRYVLYKDLIYICKVFKSDIYFKKNIVKDIFNSLTDNLSIFTKQIIKSKADSHPLLNKKDIENVRMFVGSIGTGDVDFEINNINSRLSVEGKK